MKTKAILLAMICTLSKAQTLENSYPAPSQSYIFGVVELSIAGYKYQINDVKNEVVKLYNLNHSIYKTIPVPKPTGFNYSQYPQVSDSLFNTDNAVEVMYGYALGNFTATPATYTTEIKIVNESGSTIFNIADGLSGSVVNTGSNGYKLVVQVDSANKLAVKQTNVYSLAGGLPAHATGLKGTKPTEEYISSPVPNPSNGKAVIGYQLPEGQTIGTIVVTDINGKEIKHYQVDNSFNTLELDNTDLASGTYFYQMAGSSSGKKMVIVK